MNTGSIKSRNVLETLYIFTYIMINRGPYLEDILSFKYLL